VVVTEKLSPPFRLEELPEAFKVVDAEGRDVAYVYYRPPGTAPIGTGGLAARMSKETARRMAAQIARLPGLLSKG
jgi:hypothetical protein